MKRTAPEQLDNDQLIEEHNWLASEIVEYQAHLTRVEIEFRHRLEEDGATEYKSDVGKAELKEGSATYDHTKLMALFEQGPGFQTELVSAGAYIPEHDETKTIPAKFNATKLKPFAKRGDDVRDVIEGARIPGRISLKITLTD